MEPGSTRWLLGLLGMDVEVGHMSKPFGWSFQHVNCVKADGKMATIEHVFEELNFPSASRLQKVLDARGIAYNAKAVGASRAR